MRTFAIELNRRNRQSIVLQLHPGTVATDLSKPFQSNVRKGKLFTPEYSAEKLMSVIDQATAEDSGSFFAYDGSRIPW